MNVTNQLNGIVNETVNSALHILKDECLKTIRRKLVLTLNISEHFIMYEHAIQVLKDISPLQFKKHCGRFRNGGDSTEVLSDDISYTICLKSKNYIHVKTYTNRSKPINIRYNGTMVNINNDDGNFIRYIDITFIGPKRRVVRDKFLKRVEHQLLTANKIKIFPHGPYNVSIDKRPRDFNSIVLPNNVKQDIINRITEWLNNKDWYEQHNLVYKTGLLMYGLPGTGKTSIVQAISNMLGNIPIYMLDSSLSEYRSIVQEIRRFGRPSIVLIEDIDMLFGDDTYKNDQSINTRFNEYDNSEVVPVSEEEAFAIDERARNVNSYRQNILFQILDGNLSCDNVIYIATTNHKENLDSALTRPGRFDIQVELNYFDYDLALEFVKKFGYDESVLDSFNLIYPVQPAYLQSRIMGYRANLIHERTTDYEKNE